MNKLDIFPILFYILILSSFRYRKGNIDCLFEIENSNIIKGIATIAVILCHMALRTEGGLLFPKCAEYGTYAVSLFFLLSGYGLIKQHKTKKNYERTFLIKRLSKILGPFIIMHVVSWLYHLSTGNFVTYETIIAELLEGKCFVSYSWYVYVIIELYLIFYISMKLFKNNYHNYIILSLLACLLNYLLFKKLDFNSAWYDTTIFFVFGMFLSLYEDKIVKLLNKYYYLILAISILLYFIIFEKKIHIFNSSLIITTVEVLSINLLILCIQAKLSLKSKIWNFVSSISYEIYLVHGLVIKAIDYYLFESMVLKENYFLWTLLTLVLSIIGGYILNLVCTRLFDTKRILRH